ncbi:MAG: biopolymer transporter ExbD [Myxococcales bacterium]|jgi:biopolymer transport protein ExbD/biopolymer transport protein TolR
MAMDLGSKGGKPGRAQPSMNVTPLVDVVLVLLIIFMVITPLLAKQFWLSLPNEKKDDSPPPEQVDDDDRPIVVSVTEKGEIKINHDVIPREQFETKLRRVLAAKQVRTIFFDAEDDAEFGAAVDAMDLARGGGAATIAVLTDPINPGD